jgi:hypothetical protein
MMSLRVFYEGQHMMRSFGVCTRSGKDGQGLERYSFCAVYEAGGLHSLYTPVR